jgi:mono/diheme cytochrome c family protein
MRPHRLLPGLLSGAAALALTACHHNMYEQPKFLPDQQNLYFPKEPADRKPVAHTVPRGAFDDGSVFYTGQTAGGGLATDFPVPATPALVARGREMFDINCSACHGRDGYGEGIVVQRGFPQPPSFHSDRLRAAPVGHFFDVITEGYGVMYPFGSRINPADRWAIISYIRALQLSQHATAGQLAPADNTQLEKVQ